MTIKLQQFLIIILIFISPVFSGGNELKSKISDILTKVPKGTNYGILVVEPVSNDTVYVCNDSALMVPASVTKLFTTLSSLTLMGPDYLLSTKLFSTDRNIGDGILNGDLIIKGYGNSLFTSDSLSRMVRTLKQAGVVKITGNIIGDDSFFDDEYYRKDWIEDEPGGVNIPPISALVLDRNTVLVKKKVRRRKFKMVNEYVTHPAEFVAGALLRHLRAEGITVLGEAVAGTLTAGATEITASSIKVRNLIKVINKRSDNFLAECLYKTMGAVYSKKEGSAFYSSQALYSFLDRHDIVTDGLQIADGSGLSHNNLVSVRSVVSLLEWSYLNLSVFDEFQQSLSVAGDDGTLRNRMSHSGGWDFHGKTGTLNGLSSIAGYLKCQNGQDLILAMIFEYNEKRAKYYKGIQDEIIKALAGYK